MAYGDIPRLYSFSLGDLHQFEKCLFSFLVKHHLEKKYELEEGSENGAIGTLLDLSIKKLHLSKAYDQPLDYLLSSLFAAAENEIKETVKERGEKSFYGATIKFLTPEVKEKAKQVFKNYYLTRKGKINKSLPYVKFWECLLEGSPSTSHSTLRDEPSGSDSKSSRYKIWGGPDALEMGDDGVVEIVDYKYLDDSNNLDMDLMPKLYTLLCAKKLEELGYKRVRFRVRLWQEPLNESFYEEFDLSLTPNLKDFFKLKIEKILSITDITFCEKPYCKACQSDQRRVWVKLLGDQFNLS